MKLLIIGGTGLISTAIKDQLIERGDSVSVLNRGVSALRGTKPTEIILGDRNDEALLGSTLKRGRFDAVIDMMAFAPGQAEALLRLADGQTPQIVVCSTVCVYGGPLTRLPADDNEPHRSVGDYGRNKSKIEALVLGRESASQHATVIRPSYTTGEGATTGGLVFDDSTVSRLRAGKPVVVMDEGKAAWAIAHVSDVARAFVNSLGNAKAYGKAYHATSDEHTDWNGVFAAMAEAAGAPAPKLAHIPSDWLYRSAPRRTVGIEYIFKYGSVFDNAKAARDLGFKTTVPLVETYRRQIAWMEAEGKLRKVEEESVQTELIAAWAEKRDIRPGSFEDWNPWGNGTTG